MSHEKSVIPVPVQQIRVHINPDLDPIASVAAILLLGEDYFPGLSQKTQVKFVPSGVLPRGENAQELEKKGVLTLDTGFGIWDHHQNGNTEKCTFDLIIEALKLSETPWLKCVLDFIRNQDLKGENVKFQGNEVSVLLTSIFHGIHLKSAKLHEAVENFWTLVEVMEAVIIAAKHFNEFAQGINEFQNAEHPKHQKEGEPWFFEVELAYMNYLWEEYNNIKGKYITTTFPNLIVELDAQSKKEDWSLSESLGHGKLFQFMKDRGGFENGANSALFSVFGVTFGLYKLGYAYQERIDFLSRIFSALAHIDTDWDIALADWRDPKTSRVIKFNSIDNRKVIIMCAIESNTYAAAKAARFADAGEYRSQIVICFRRESLRPNHNGGSSLIPWQTQIVCLNNPWWRERLHLAVVTLRVAERFKQDGHFPGKRKYAELEATGVCNVCSEWFFGPVGSNRTLTNPEAPRTTLTKSQIMRLVQKALFLGAVPRYEDIKGIIESKELKDGWPSDPKYPWIFNDIRNK